MSTPHTARAVSPPSGAPPELELHVHRADRCVWLTVSGDVSHPAHDRALLRQLRTVHRRLGPEIEWLGVDLTDCRVTVELAVLIGVERRLCSARGISLVAVLHPGAAGTPSAAALMQALPLIAPGDPAHDRLTRSARDAREGDHGWTALTHPRGERRRSRTGPRAA